MRHRGGDGEFVAAFVFGVALVAANVREADAVLLQQLVEAAPEPFAEMHPLVAKRHGLVDGAPVVLRTRRGSATFASRITADIRPDTVFVPFHWPGESSSNRMTNDALDPVSRMPEFKVCAVRIEIDE
jgi:assimilatory nitrate reductase catalytic subunit